MPVYEFYCSDCNTIFNFFSGTVNTEKRPACPKCNNKVLERLVSLFSVRRGVKEEEPLPSVDLDENKMMKAMSMLENEAKNIKEDDPRQAANLMRKLFETAGLNPGSGMEEVMRRLERGDDPETIEAEMGDISEEDIIDTAPKTAVKPKKTPPLRDETLYML